MVVNAISSKGITSKLYTKIHLAAVEKDLVLTCRVKWEEDVGELTDDQWDSIKISRINVFIGV